MRKRFLILIGFLSAALFAVASLPARLVIGPLSEKMTTNEPNIDVRVQQVGGTIWDGYVLLTLPPELNRMPVTVSWDVKAVRLFLGELALGLGAESRDFRFSGFGFWGLGGKGVSSLTGDIQAKMFERFLREQGVSVNGELTLKDITLGISDGLISEGSGVVQWSGGNVKLPQEAGGNTVDLPGLRAELQENAGDLRVPIVEIESNQPLGEFELLMKDGLYSITVLQRVLALAGQEINGSEDKVLIKQQQPLSFDFQ